MSGAMSHNAISINGGRQRVICADVLDALLDIPTASVDLVFADPPFNVGVGYDLDRTRDSLSPLVYRDWCAYWIGHCFRVLKDTGTFYLMTIERHLPWLFPMMSTLGKLINLVMWYNVSAVKDARRFWPAMQPILVYGKTDGYIFNTYAERRTGIERWGKWRTAPQGQMLNLWNDIPAVHAGSIRHPEAVIEPGTNSKAHPAQMPVALAARAIRFSIEPDALVLDPFLGSGTTGVACVENGRRLIGIERSDKYVALSVERIQSARPPLFLMTEAEVIPQQQMINLDEEREQ